jgi:hypothetical protein
LVGAEEEVAASGVEAEGLGGGVEVLHGVVA